jgi:pimeloyl-ACP methyl ester carboxylesterase
MATFVLIHGAGSDSWYWHLVVPRLQAHGHDVVAPDLPSDDDAAGLDEYTDTVVRAIGDRRDLVVVGQSLGGLTAPLVCDRAPAKCLVLLVAIVPAPGERPREWWANTGFDADRREQAQREGADLDGDFDVLTEFFHDVPDDVTAEAMARGERAQSGTPLDDPWPLTAWPAVPTRFLLCRDDRCFPAPFMRRVVRERLGIVADEMDGGHLPALAHPAELVDRLLAYERES